MAHSKNLIRWHMTIVVKVLMFVSMLMADCLELGRMFASFNVDRAIDLIYGDAGSKEYLGSAPMILVSQGAEDHLRNFDSLNAC